MLNKDEYIEHLESTSNYLTDDEEFETALLELNETNYEDGIDGEIRTTGLSDESIE